MDRTGLSPPLRVPELDALLREVDELRLALGTDLAFAAAAAECGARALAAGLLEHERAQLRGFEQRALRHLARLAWPPAPLAVPLVAAVHAVSRALGLAPGLADPEPDVAGSALDGPPTAGSALDGPPTAGGGGTPGGRSGSPTPVCGSGRAVLAAWQDLARLAEQGASAEVLRSAAERVSAQLAAMVGAAEEPGAARQALAVLRSGQQVLRTAGDVPPLAELLTHTAALVARLCAALPAATPDEGARAATGAAADA